MDIRSILMARRPLYIRTIGHIGPGLVKQKYLFPKMEKPAGCHEADANLKQILPFTLGSCQNDRGLEQLSISEK